jgi:transformation/transcription domain-associated protein
MLVEPQKLDYVDGASAGQCIVLFFPDHKNHVSLPLETVIEVAIQTLKSTITPQSADIYYKKQAWNFLKVFVLSSLELDSDLALANKVILHQKMSEPDQMSSTPIQRAIDEKNRMILTHAFTGWFIATGIKELKKEVYSLLVPLFRHLTLVMTVQQVGAFANKACNMDPYCVFDAMMEVLANEERDLKRPVLFGLSVILNCAINILRSKNMVRKTFYALVRMIFR